MTDAKYDRTLASTCYINIKENGDVEAGMILENGEVLTATLLVGTDRVEAERETLINYSHRLILEREGDSIVRYASFFGTVTVIEEFSAEIPRGIDYWAGGSRR